VETDAYNRIWVGTQNGIAILSGNRFISSTIDQGGASNSINFLKYFNGSMWFGTNNGLYSTEVGEKIREESLIIRRYGMEDGLRSLETNLNAVYVDKQNRLWFGTTEGVMCLEPELLQERELKALPKVALTDVQIDFLNPDWKKFKAEIDAVTGFPLHPSVDYKSNHFTFKFTGISMSYPDEVKYQFMLEGFDEEWQAVTEANFITYSNLPYNTFRFKVRPPFWFTWWFILLEVLFGAALVLGIWYVRRRVVRARFERERLEMRSRMLTLEQQSLNSSMNRHFIFNALNSIQYYINRQDRLAANKYLSDFARLIRKNLDSSQETLTPLRDEMERLELYLKLEHMRFKDKFEYSISIDPDIPQDLIKVPAMLLQPFLENSIWHGLLPKKEAGWVKVNLSRRDNSLHMIIEDNGVGIENSLKSKTGTDSHISKGMEITQSRIDLIQKMSGEKVQLIGPKQVNSEGGEVMGTKVEIIIPVNFSELFSQ
jgi:two-component sensor histidine kinase